MTPRFIAPSVVDAGLLGRMATGRDALGHARAVLVLGLSERLVYARGALSVGLKGAYA